MQDASSFVSTSRELLQADLRTYGEEELASRVPYLDDAAMRRIGEVALPHACTGMLIAKALALAAVEVLEGASRPLKRGRRRLKGIYPGL